MDAAKSTIKIYLRVLLQIINVNVVSAEHTALKITEKCIAAIWSKNEQELLSSSLSESNKNMLRHLQMSFMLGQLLY